jgi:cytochrome c-type biogenesis protein CcmH/NrfG
MTSAQMTPAMDSVKVKAEIAKMEEQLKSDPNNYEALVDLGNAYYDIDNPPKAIEYYERALRIKPNQAPILVDMGAMYRQSGDPDKALELFIRATQIDPDLSQAYFNLGMIYRMEKNDPASAARAWRKYLELEPNSQARELIEGLIKKAESDAK